MPKFMNNRFMMDLQMFAEGENNTGEDPGDGGGQDDDQEEELSEDGDDEPKYTQADLDKAVARTIAKERAKAERAAKRAQKKEESSEEENEDVKARKEAEGKASRLEVKVACFEADVAKDAVDDVAALAHAYMEADDSLDLEEAIEKVVKKYPQFKKGGRDPYEEEAGRERAWGERMKSGPRKKRSGVEEAFLNKNPGLKID